MSMVSRRPWPSALHSTLALLPLNIPIGAYVVYDREERSNVGDDRGGEQPGARRSLSSPVMMGDGTSPKMCTHTDVSAMANDLHKGRSTDSHEILA